MHSLLARQIRRAFGKSLDQMPADWIKFLEIVNDAYGEFDRDRALLERSMELSSQELIQANRELRASLKEITERKHLEQMLFQSEKMAAVGQLAAGVAHEMNNPLCVILGFTQSLQSRLALGGSDKNALNYIEQETQRCRRLVQSMLTFSQDSHMNEMEPLELNAAVEEALDLVLSKSKCAKIELVKTLQPGLEKLRASRSQILQVVINLCNNAIDSMPNGGLLQVRTQFLLEEGKPCQILDIEDNGCGIPKDIQSKIFDPFFTTKEVGKGTGLGLALVYEIIRRHKGNITVKSETGHGSLFRVFWPQ